MVVPTRGTSEEVVDCCRAGEGVVCTTLTVFVIGGFSVHSVRILEGVVLELVTDPSVEIPVTVCDCEGALPSDFPADETLVTVAAEVTPAEVITALTGVVTVVVVTCFRPGWALLPLTPI